MPKSGTVKVKKKGPPKKKSARRKKPAETAWQQTSAAEIAAEDRKRARGASEAREKISRERSKFRAAQRPPRSSKKRR